MATTVNEGPERLLIERTRLKPIETLAVTAVTVLATLASILFLSIMSD